MKILADKPDINGSKRRRTPGVHMSPPPRDEAGNKLCRNCRGPMPAGRNYYNCSPECSEEWMEKTSPSHMRYLVWRRDKGVCSACGIDSVAGKRYSRGLIPNDGPPRHNWAHGTGDLWQADHIVPVVEGGGECGLAGFRTLCTACHKAETAALARRRAEARSNQMRIPLDLKA